MTALLDHVIPVQRESPSNDDLPRTGRKRTMGKFRVLEIALYRHERAIDVRSAAEVHVAAVSLASRLVVRPEVLVAADALGVHGVQGVTAEPCVFNGVDVGRGVLDGGYCLRA